MAVRTCVCRVGTCRVAGYHFGNGSLRVPGRLIHGPRWEMLSANKRTRLKGRTHHIETGVMCRTCTKKALLSDGVWTIHRLSFRDCVINGRLSSSEIPENSIRKPFVPI
jgi:hypothetical protein